MPARCAACLFTLGLVLAFGCGEPLPEDIVEPPCEGEGCPVTVRIRLETPGPVLDERRWLVLTQYPSRDRFTTAALPPGPGPFDFEVAVTPGVFTIRHFHAPVGQPAPALGIELNRGRLVIESDVALTYTAGVTAVRGEVTLDGQPLPEDVPDAAVRRGHLLLEHLHTERRHRVALPPTGPARFRMNLPAEAFRVFYEPTHDAPCLDGCPWVAPESAIPPGMAELDLLLLYREVERDEVFDVPVIDVWGRLERDDPDMPLPRNGVAEGGAAAAVVFELLNTDRAHIAPVRSADGRDFFARMYPGTYRVRLATNGARFQDAFAPDVNLGTSRRAFWLAESGELCPFERDADGTCRRWAAEDLYGE